MSAKASALCGQAGERVALCDVAVTAVLADLLAEVTLTQTYRNDERTNIEAAYTFPLPLDAVLLSLDVMLGGRRLRGTVVEKSEAENRYEDAIAEGDAAVMLQNPEPGLYTMNVGNLLPGEQAKITVRYALLLRWSGDQLRLHVPTTIAPRYGASPLAPHQAPESSLTVENRFSLRVEVHGALRDARFECPTHAVHVSHSEHALVLALDEARAVMDRDFVLNIRAPQAERNFVMTGRDGDGATAIASFQPFFPGLRASGALDMIIVVDCSGSMAGDSMAQAKRALDAIVERLEPRDSIGVVAFGSTTQLMARAMLGCTPANVTRARQFLSTLDANLGGTEIGAALEAAYTMRSGRNRPDIFLITDGEVGDWQPVVERACAAGRRIFTVGVGSAVSEAFVRQLASATRGECELVTPGEGMAERVVRHFERMRAPRAESAVVHWPEGAVDIHPADLGSVFEGDTVVASARLPSREVRGDVVMEIRLSSGAVVRQALPLATASKLPNADELSTVARVAAARRMPTLSETDARATALQYQLVGPHTHWLVVAERAEGEKPEHLPALRKVPQTMAAGWGGVGTAFAENFASPLFNAPAARMRMAAPDPSHSIQLREASERPELFAEVFDSAPMFLRGRDRDDPHQLNLDAMRKDDADQDLPEFDIGHLCDRVRRQTKAVTLEHAWVILLDAGYLPLFEKVMSRAEALGVEVRYAAAIVLDHLLRTYPGRGVLGQEATRAAATLATDVEAIVQRIGSDVAAELRRLTDQAVLSAQSNAAEHDVT